MCVHSTQADSLTGCGEVQRAKQHISQAQIATNYNLQMATGKEEEEEREEEV